MDPITYLFVAQFLISLMLMVVFLVAWKTIEPQPYTLLWALVFALAVANGLINVLRESFTSPYIYWVVVSASSLAIQASTIAGFRQRAGLSPMPNFLIGYFVITLGLVFWFTVIEHHMGLRMMFVPISTTIVMVAIVWTLLTYEVEKSATIIAACVVYLIYAVTQAASAVVVLFQGAEPDDEIIALYQQINLLAQPALFTGMGLFTALILADDLARRMRTLAITDALSGLVNRRGLDDAARRALAFAKRQEQPLTLVVADIDHFKEVNDVYGHAAGDRVIEKFSQILIGSLRGEDIAARIGGEEFALLLPGTDKAEAANGIERLRQVVENTTFGREGSILKITASFGIASVEGTAETLNDAMLIADEALYKAKRSGRNCVEVGV